MPEEQEFPEEVVAPVLATAAACVVYVAVNDEVYADFVRWSKENVTAPRGLPEPKPPNQKVLVMAASILVQLAAGNLTSEQAMFLQLAKIIAEGGLN